MPSLRFHGVSFRYQGHNPLIDNVDIHLTTGWTGLVGANGCGKSTLLQLVTGALAPDQGSVVCDPCQALVVLCEQELPGPDAMVQLIAQGEDREAYRLRARLGLVTDELVRWETLSAGERKRWQIAAALYQRADILLLDEPTNHVDDDTRAMLVEALRSFRGLGLVVSHDRPMLDELTHSTLWMHNGKVQWFAAPYSEAREQREAERERAFAQREQAKTKVRTLEHRLANARRNREAAENSSCKKNIDRHDSDARSIVRQNVVNWAEDKLGREVGKLRAARDRAIGEIPAMEEQKELGRSVFLGYEAPERRVLLSLRGQRLQAGSRVLLENVDFQLLRGERVHLRGANGAGKSTLLQTLLAQSSLPLERLLVLPQEHTPLQVRGMLQELRDMHPEKRGRVYTLLAALGSSPEGLGQAQTMSPGEARKLHLALGMGRHVWALILDEPTNHLDLPSVERLGIALGNFPGAILLVSHDAEFAKQCTQRAFCIKENGLEEVFL